MDFKMICCGCPFCPQANTVQSQEGTEEERTRLEEHEETTKQIEADHKLAVS